MCSIYGALASQHALSLASSLRSLPASYVTRYVGRGWSRIGCVTVNIATLPSSIARDRRHSDAPPRARVETCCGCAHRATESNEMPDAVLGIVVRCPAP